mmetsp:Transcript_17827/g.24891  ORF Transcript_17827/g.24891 Transcript_17827/m.24891 type:complete len:88 (-) Transcript_17827:248-511(-)
MLTYRKRSEQQVTYLLPMCTLIGFQKAGRFVFHPKGYVPPNPATAREEEDRTCWELVSFKDGMLFILFYNGVKFITRGKGTKLSANR